MDRASKVLLEFLRTWSLAIAACSVVGCASFYGIVETPPAKPEPELTLSVAEAQSQNLVLKIAAPDAAVKKWTLLEIFRIDDDSEPQVVQEILLDDRIRNALKNGVEFVDSGLQTERKYTYFLHAFSESGEAFSEPVQILWRKAPDTPEELTSKITLGAVRLSWVADSNVGAVVFRRNVLIDGSAPERVGSVATGVTEFVDTNVAEGDVFAYQIALAHLRDNWRHFGPASEPIYVTVENSPRKNNPEPTGLPVP